MYVYVFATVVGLGLLIASLLLGHGHDLDGDGVPDVSGEHESAAGLFSMRAFTYLLGFGGLTGILARAVAHVPEPWAALVAVSTGLCAALIGRYVIAKFAKDNATTTSLSDSIIGKTGTVIVAPTASNAGKVRVQLSGRTLDLIATSEDPLLRARDEVLVLGLDKDNNAQVTRTPVRAVMDNEVAAGEEMDHDASSTSDRKMHR